MPQTKRIVNARHLLAPSNGADPTHAKGKSTPTQTKHTRANQKIGAAVNPKRSKKNQKPRTFWLDIGKQISLELTSIEYGFDIVDADLDGAE